MGVFMSVREYIPTLKNCSCMFHSLSSQTQPAQIPSSACSDSTFNDMEVCYTLSQNLKIAWGRLQNGSTGKSFR